MRSRYHISVTFAFLAYFATFLIGRPVLEPFEDSEKAGFSASRFEMPSDSEMDQLLENTPEALSLEKKPVETTKVSFQPGLIQQILLIRETLNTFEDPLLESDARPDRFFRELERALLIRFFTATITVFWSFAALLLLTALFRGHWFARPMTLMVLTPAVLTVFFLLIGPRRDDLFLAGWTAVTAFKIILESSLFFLGLAGLYLFFFPITGDEAAKTRPFLDHLQKKRLPFTRVLMETWTVFFQLGIVILSSLVIANFFLLPLYQLQLNFPELFGFLLIPGLLSLAVFYIFAYVRVARLQNEGATYIDGLAFLGYRFMRNATFLFSLLTLIAIMVVVIVVLSLMNVDFLQTISILKRPETM